MTELSNVMRDLGLDAERATRHVAACDKFRRLRAALTVRALEPAGRLSPVRSARSS